MGNLLQDLRYGLRMLIKNPGFTAVAVLSLALGIGANTAIFTLVDNVLLRPLAVEEPDRLALVLSSRPKDLNYNFSYPLYRDMRDQNNVFSDLLAYSRVDLNLSEGDQTERIEGEIVSGNYFSALGINPTPGRAFLPEEDRTPGAHPVAVISYGLWQRRLGSDPGIIGKSLKLSGYDFTVIGVAPEGFDGIYLGNRAEIWVPMMMQQQVESRFGELLNESGSSWLYIIGRLKPGIDLAQGEAGLQPLYRHIQETHNRPLEDQITLRSGRQGHSTLPGDLSLSLWLLMGGVGLVLLIACANIANLLLARSAARSKEIAIRLAIGAGRGRLVRQLMTESLLLALLGGAGGIILAFWSTDLLAALLPNDSFAPVELDLALDARVLGFAFLLSLVTGILFGLAPALNASRPDLVATLKEETARFGRGSRRFGLRNLLVVMQVALSLLLLVGAGLFVRTLQNLRGLDLGFDNRNILLMSVDLSKQGYTRERGQEFYRQLIERAGSLPGVRSVAWASVPPVNAGGSRATVDIEGYTPQTDEEMELNFLTIGPGYFQTLGIPIVRGREFNEQDKPGTPGGFIINETMAHRYLPGQDPLGKRISMSGPDGPFLEIVGVVADSKYRSMRERPRPSYYIPMSRAIFLRMAVLHVHTDGDPKALIAAVGNEVRALDKDLPVYNVKTLSDQLDQALGEERLATTLSSLFALLALLLAAIGIYGVMAYSVGRRTREIGIRMALGAQKGDVLRLVLGESLILVLVGIAIGLGAAFYVTRSLESLLYEVSATDPLTFASISLLLVVVALAAAYLPARRAAKVDPMTALRYE
ncbi:MAG: ABC transporter permease [Blastocatellia bacterium]|nr:ABC transporter permease [Blastocatellia bacterium]